jgi:ATP-dependent RNA helicase DeaD
VSYRIEVGEQHGVRPANIVGAICNEAGLETKDIGRIDIQRKHSIVELPAEFSETAWEALQNCWVSGQQLKIAFVGADDAPPARDKAQPRNHANFRKHKPPAAFQHAKKKKKAKSADKDKGKPKWTKKAKPTE